MTETPAYSCALPPSRRIPEYAALAEALGFKRLWLFDSPALYGDIWVSLALAAQATSRIGLGTGVAIPSMRHPMVTASAIATVEEISPHRLTVALGTGYTGRIVMGLPPMRWADVGEYVTQLRGLLAGQTVQIDGRSCRMVHSAGFAPDRPIDVPVWVAPSGPKGFEVAKRLGVKGVLTPGLPAEDQRGFAECGLLVTGTVARPGEDHTSRRLIEAVGPAYTTGIHGLFVYAPEMIDSVPGGAPWKEAFQPPTQRAGSEEYLQVHAGHLCTTTERDRPLVEAAGPALLQSGWTGDAASISDRLDQAGSCVGSQRCSTRRPDRTSATR